MTDSTSLNRCFCQCTVNLTCRDLVSIINIFLCIAYYFIHFWRSGAFSKLSYEFFQIGSSRKDLCALSSNFYSANMGVVQTKFWRKGGVVAIILLGAVKYPCVPLNKGRGLVLAVNVLIPPRIRGRV